MPSSLLNSNVLATHITQSQGQFAELIEYSVDGDNFKSTRVVIDSRGSLIADSDTTLIRHLQSCGIQILETCIVVTPHSSKDRPVWLKPSDKETLSRLLACLVFWQALKPRGILYKTLNIPFDPSGVQEQNLLVASCKIYGTLPKNSKNTVETVQGPLVPLYPEQNEQWFTAMAVLKSNGMLELINESDGKALYTIDIKQLTRSEIRELHHSICESSNYLYVGLIEDLRRESVKPCQYTQSAMPQISRELPKAKRIIMEFPYRIDVEDWLVALKSFAIRQYAGLNKSYLFRVSRKLNFDILEGSLTEPLVDDNGKPAKLYAEVQMWGAPWFRTAIVESSRNPFFREEFEIDLPLSTQSFTVALKRASSQLYQNDDEVIGSTLLTYEDFRGDVLGKRVPVFHDGYEVGQICISIHNQTNYVLSPEHFNNFEQMILNIDLKQLLNYVLSKNSQSDLQRTAVVLLDIFQSLQKEHGFFAALINEEITKIMNTPANANNLYNSLFRGNSLLTKSLEMYNLRIGQEYLEKVIGHFITSVISQNLPTEIDPMRIQEPDPVKKQEIINTNFKVLLRYAEEVWRLIYQTSNDVPEAIKQQLTLLRKQIELYTNDETLTLNCITGFIFLRFFCPVILNPKLFFLTKEHQTGDIKRTLTLISKILLTFANRQTFGAKEPYMTDLNSQFIEKRKQQLLDYLDKITGKKLDFTDKKLKLSSSLERTDIILTSKGLIKELPTVPFLIDKYLRADQLADLLTNEVINPDIIDDFGDMSEEEADPETSTTNLYKIGSLEFEKLGLSAHQGDADGDLNGDATNGGDESFEFGSEKFITKLLDTSDSAGVFSYINANSSLKDLIVESDRISSKKARLAAKLCASETAKDIVDIAQFTQQILNTTIVDPHRRVLKAPSGLSSLRYMKSDSSLGFKFKFSSQYQSQQREDDTASVITKSPTKKLSMIIRSSSFGTISSYNSSTTDERRKKGLMSKWFKKKDTSE